MPKLARILSSLSALVAGLFCLEARAVQPPDRPLPECVYVAGQPAGGACPKINDFVAGNAAGRVAAGAPVVVRTVPLMPVCDFWSANTYEAIPSGCYSSVSAPVIAGCATIDLRTEQYRELPCTDALYTRGTELPPTLFTMQRPSGHGDPHSSTACGATPAYHVYLYGGPATEDTHVWRARGPKALDCEVTLAGSRPNGLYGPTWVKVRVQVTRGETGIFYPGPTQQAELYVPVDGDLRDAVNVGVEASGSLTEVNWDADRLFATYRATVTNLSATEARNVVLTGGFPSVFLIESFSGDGCTEQDAAATRAGGTVACSWPTLAGHESRELEIVARIINATDLDGLQNNEPLEVYAGSPNGVRFFVRAEADASDVDNDVTAKVDIPFRGGSYAETRSLMESLAPYFDYQTDQLRQQCNVYKDDIYARLQQINADRPGVFAGLSYGGVTSGQYSIAGIQTEWTRAGHVGVVVYAKGTNYRKTGIVINGTPSPSPIAASSEIGPSDPGLGFGAAGWTAMNGWYLRTPANQFPGTVQKEGSGLEGFEGSYPHNAQEFSNAGAVPPPAGSDAGSCPVAPNGVMITTESPVEIIATNASGQRVETQDGRIVVQELDTGIHSMAFPHEDGTYGWTILLPVDDYELQVIGTRTGSYRLIRTTFDPDGTLHEQVTEGQTSIGQIDEYTLEAPEPVTEAPLDPTPVTPPPPSGGGNNIVNAPKRGGGGAFDVGLLMLLLACGLRITRRSHV